MIYGHDCSKRTYTSWDTMTQRCTNPNNIAYKWYGGRGITICERWRKFANFLIDMGDRPEGTTLDRIDSNGNYEPSNCRWATRDVQHANQRHVGFTSKDYCPRGHINDKINSYGAKTCSICHAEAQRRYVARKRGVLS